LGGEGANPFADLKNDPRFSGLADHASRAMKELDALNSQPRAQFAQVATADSQSLLRSQFQAKEAAERKKEADRLRKLLEDMLRELREARKAQEDQEDIDDVNIG
jgi:thioester reductase-like protein